MGKGGQRCAMWHSEVALDYDGTAGSHASLLAAFCLPLVCSPGSRALQPRSQPTRITALITFA